PTLVSRPPVGEGWLHEPKFDGWRIQIIKSGRDVSFLTRNRNDITKRLPALAEACRGIRGRSCVIDGELVGGDAGRLDLWSLQRMLGAGRSDCISVVAFDLMHANGVDLRQRPID